MVAQTPTEQQVPVPESCIVELEIPADRLEEVQQFLDSLLGDEDCLDDEATEDADEEEDPDWDADDLSLPTVEGI